MQLRQVTSAPWSFQTFSIRRTTLAIVGMNLPLFETLPAGLNEKVEEGSTN
jgi:hypothetical protein